MACDQVAVALRFAANDRRAHIGSNESVERGEVGHAVVDPHLQGWKRFTDAAQRREIVPEALDRVEIGDIERWKGIDRQKAAHDIHRVAGRRKRRFERPVRRPVSHLRADDLAMQEVKDWDNPQRSLRRPVREEGTHFVVPTNGVRVRTAEFGHNFRASSMKLNASKRQ